MEIDQLRVFLALCGEGGFSAAARKLYKSHSSISRTLCALERELGVKLAERDRHSFSLTAAGRALRDGAGELLAQADALAEKVTAEGEEKN